MWRRGQSWSMDVVLAVVVFGFVTIAITSLILFKQTNVEKLENQAERVVISLEGTLSACNAVLDDNQIISTELECLFNQDYNTIKEEIRVRDNFCIYLEDDQGRLMPVVDTGTGERWHGFGSDELSVAGEDCGVRIP